MLARALVGNPELPVLDEPTTGVDTASVERIVSNAERLNQEEGVTILMVTHASVKECAGISRIYHMEEVTGGTMSMLEYGFMQRAFIVGILLAVITPCIGITIVKADVHDR